MAKLGPSSIGQRPASSSGPAAAGLGAALGRAASRRTAAAALLDAGAVAPSGTDSWSCAAAESDPYLLPGARRLLLMDPKAAATFIEQQQGGRRLQQGRREQHVGERQAAGRPAGRQLVAEGWQQQEHVVREQQQPGHKRSATAAAASCCWCCSSPDASHCCSALAPPQAGCLAPSTLLLGLLALSGSMMVLDLALAGKTAGGVACVPLLPAEPACRAAPATWRQAAEPSLAASGAELPTASMLPLPRCMFAMPAAGGASMALLLEEGLECSVVQGAELVMPWAASHGGCRRRLLAGDTAECRGAGAGEAGAAVTAGCNLAASSQLLARPSWWLVPVLHLQAW